MPLDPQAKAFLAQFPPMPDFDAIPLPLLRQGFEGSALAPGEPEAVAHVENLRLPGPDGDPNKRVNAPGSGCA